MNAQTNYLSVQQFPKVLHCNRFPTESQVAFKLPLQMCLRHGPEAQCANPPCMRTFSDFMCQCQCPSVFSELFICLNVT